MARMCFFFYGRAHSSKLQLLLSPVPDAKAYSISVQCSDKAGDDKTTGRQQGTARRARQAKRPGQTTHKVKKSHHNQADRGPADVGSETQTSVEGERERERERERGREGERERERKRSTRGRNCRQIPTPDRRLVSLSLQQDRKASSSSHPERRKPRQSSVGCWAIEHSRYLATILEGSSPPLLVDGGSLLNHVRELGLKDRHGRRVNKRLRQAIIHKYICIQRSIEQSAIVAH